MSANNYIKGIDFSTCSDKIINRNNINYKIVQNNGLQSNSNVGIFEFES